MGSIGRGFNVRLPQETWRLLVADRGEEEPLLKWFDEYRAYEEGGNFRIELTITDRIHQELQTIYDAACAVGVSAQLSIERIDGW